MKAIIARHGLPMTVVSDNGLQFGCREFKTFAKEYGFEHVTSSPEYPQSNGKAEKAVQIVKRLLKKAKEAETDPYLALLNYRAAPVAGDKSPGEICMHRHLRTKLPSVHGHVNSQNKETNNNQKKYYDRGTKVLAPVNAKDTVRLQRKGVWQEKAQVQQQVAPNSYLVQTESGSYLRRNRRHLLKTQEAFQPEISLEELEMEVGQSMPENVTGTDEQVGLAEIAKEMSSGEAQLVFHNGPVQDPVLKTTRSGRVIKRPSRFVQ